MKESSSSGEGWIDFPTRGRAVVTAILYGDTKEAEYKLSKMSTTELADLYESLNEARGLVAREIITRGGQPASPSDRLPRGAA